MTAGPDSGRPRQPPSMPGLERLVSEAAERCGLAVSATALYLSAGRDTRPFVLLQRAFLDHRGLTDMLAPDVFVYVDKQHGSPGTDDLHHEDDHTCVSATAAGSIANAVIWRVGVDSDRAEFRRSFALVRLRARNQRVLREAALQAWAPDVLITVCCGCAYGGQPPDPLRRGHRRCEAMPLLEADRAGTLMARGTRWWVTDHFARDVVDTPLELRNEDRVVPRQAAVPFELVKRAKLSSEWGHRWAPWLGATAFEVTPRRRQARGGVPVDEPSSWS